jgi:hypothetical protein
MILGNGRGNMPTLIPRGRRKDRVRAGMDEERYKWVMDCLNDAKDNGSLNTWEEEFVESIADWWLEHDGLTEKQGEKLEEVYERVMNRGMTPYYDRETY